MEKIKKSVISGEFIIEIDKTGHVSVYRIYDNVIDSLREVYEKENLEYDPNWNTRQMGNNLIKQYCTDGDNTQAIIGDYLIQRRENGSIETFRDYGKGKVTEALKEVAQKVGLKVESGWNTQQLGSKLVDFINNKSQNTDIMKEININGRMTVSALKDDFKTQTGGTLRVKDGGRKADESATLASIRKDSDNKSGALALNPEMAIGDFKAKMLSAFGLKVEVGTPDDWVSVPDGITLGQLRELPKNAVRAQLEALIVGKEEQTGNDTPQFEQSPDATRVEYSEDGTVLVGCPEDFEGTLIIPDGVKEIESSAFSGCGLISAIVMTNSLVEIGVGAFYGCKNLSYIKFSTSLKKISDRAFMETGLKNIVLPNSIVYIGRDAFASCPLESISLSQNLRSIEECVFSSTKITNIIIPESVKRIEPYAFSNCNDLKEVTISGSISIGNYAFDGCTQLESVKCNSDNIFMSSCTFCDCEKLNAVALYKSLKPYDVQVNFKEIDLSKIDPENDECGILMISAIDEEGETVEYIHQTFKGIGNEIGAIEDKLEEFEDEGLTDIKVYASQPMPENEIEFATQAYQYYFQRICNFKRKIGLQGPGYITFTFPDGNVVELSVTWNDRMKIWECVY